MDLREREISLKEKLSQHYHNRNFVPRQQTIVRTGISWTGFMICSLFLEAVAVLLPGLYNLHETENSGASQGWFGEGYWVMMTMVVFTFVESLGNWWRVYMDVANYVRKETKKAHFPQSLETPPGWRHCPTCQVDAPPRSFHCNICGRCMLKRDHHCFFTGSCVGYYNQRHFVIFCMYVIWGSLLALYLQLSYLNKFMLPATANMHAYIIPLTIVKVFLGDITFRSLLLLVHIYASGFCLFLGLWFLLWQLTIITRGQTSYEAWKNIRVYNGGLFKNFRSVFGSPLQAWLLLFVPLMLPLDGDACVWHIRPKSEKGH